MRRDRIRFGIMADIHHDLVYQASDRLQRFIEHATEEQVDFIIQLGDFCHPTPENKPFRDIWERFEGGKYHVLGNHDMDTCDKRTFMNYLGMPNNYYSFDCGEYHFVVLDPNYYSDNGQRIDFSHGNYVPHGDTVGYVPDEQLAWLRADLADTDKIVIVFSHQSMEETYVGSSVGIHNSLEVRGILKEANEAAGFRKVIACMNGHNHLDGAKVIDDIYFLHINSISYFYMGPQFNEVRYSEEITNRYPVFRQSAPYQDPIFAMVTLEPGLLTIKGRASDFVGKPPVESGFSNANAGHVVSAIISDRKLKF